MEVGTVTVPATLTVSVGEGASVIATGDFGIDIEVTGSERHLGTDHVALTPQSGSIRASLARALRGFADDLDAQAALDPDPSKNPGTPF